MKVIIADDHIDHEKVQDAFHKIGGAIRDLDLNVFEVFELCCGLLSDPCTNLPPLRLAVMDRLDWHCKHRIKQAGVQ